MVICLALAGCHDILILSKSSIKWRQHPDITGTLSINSNKQRYCNIPCVSTGENTILQCIILARSTSLLQLLKWKLKCNAVPSDRHLTALNLNQNSLLLTCHIDNTSPGSAASGGKLAPGSHKTCEWQTEAVENTCIFNLYKRSPEASLLFLHN